MPPDDTPPEPIDWLLLTRYAAGDVTAAEAAAVRTWLAADPVHAERLARLRTAGVDERALGHRFDVDAAWAALAAARELTGRTQYPPRERPALSGRLQVRRTVRIASFGAVAAAVAMAGVALVWNNAVLRLRAEPFREFATEAGHRSSVTLRDGTRLVLGPATRLRVPSDFGRADRAIELDGEAMFAVVHDAAHPFAVHTERGLIRDVGTTFVVQAYVGDAEERVAVIEGEVALGRMAVTAHGLGVIGARGQVEVKAGVDLTPELTWVQGGLAFQAMPFPQAVRQLARTYNLDITIADSVLDGEAITASFTDESIDEVLDAVTRIVGARYERSGRRVVILRREAGSVRHAPDSVRPPVHMAQATAAQEK